MMMPALCNRRPTRELVTQAGLRIMIMMNSGLERIGRQNSNFNARSSSRSGGGGGGNKYWLIGGDQIYIIFILYGFKWADTKSRGIMLLRSLTCQFVSGSYSSLGASMRESSFAKFSPSNLIILSLTHSLETQTPTTEPTNLSLLFILFASS